MVNCLEGVFLKAASEVTKKRSYKQVGPTLYVCCKLQLLPPHRGELVPMEPAQVTELLCFSCWKKSCIWLIQRVLKGCVPKARRDELMQISNRDQIIV